MALTIPHPHLPHSRNQLFVDLAFGAALVAALGAGAYMIADNGSSPAVSQSSPPIARAYHGSVSALTGVTESDAASPGAQERATQRRSDNVATRSGEATVIVENTFSGLPN